MPDWSLIQNEVIALLIVWSPVEVLVVALIIALYRKVGKLSALQEMAPDFTQEERLLLRQSFTEMAHDEIDRMRSRSRIEALRQEAAR